MLCVNVFNSLGNTPVEVVMRGLLNPEEMRLVEETALSKEWFLKTVTLSFSVLSMKFSIDTRFDDQF